MNVELLHVILTLRFVRIDLDKHECYLKFVILNKVEKNYSNAHHSNRKGRCN